MAAKITTPGSVRRVLNYNEKKVQKGQAECLYAGNFLMDAGDLSFRNKLEMFQRRIELNSRAITNMMHVSLNFHPGENLSKETLVQIASRYIEGIGFAGQPFLVYQHQDAGHPHVHIVTTTIKPDGKRIDTFNIGKIQSEKARQSLEAAFGLLRAAGRVHSVLQGATPVNPQKLRYGYSETKRSITNVLDHVLDRYTFSSLPELNAVLKLYNVMADRGGEEGRIFRNRGLLYRILDAQGNKMGVPIKASSIYSKPTLSYLEEKFTKNEPLKPPFAKRLRTAIDWALHKKPSSIAAFSHELKREKIDVILRQNDQGYLYGITFINNRTCSVFNGSDLGKTYGVSGILNRVNSIAASNDAVLKQTPLKGRSEYATSGQAARESAPKNHPDLRNGRRTNITEEKEKQQELLNALLNIERTASPVPYELLKKKKKRKPPMSPSAKEICNPVQGGVRRG